MKSTDITELMLTLKDRALNAALEGITISDARQPDNPLIYVNRGFEILTGYAAAEVLGSNCRFLQGPRTDSADAEKIRHAVMHQQPCVVEILNYHKNGSAFWNRLSITPVRNRAGQTTHFIGVQSDVTARRKAEDDLRATNADMQQALDVAAQVQRSLLPHHSAPHAQVEVAWRFEPCATLAGDILNVFWLDDHRLACYVLDVVGHGVAAALLSFTLSHFLSPQGKRDPTAEQSPAQIATRLNQRFPFDNERQQFFTFLYGVLDTRDRTFLYTSAGHPPLLHVSAQGAAVRISGATGFPVGVVDNPGYENHRLQLAPGDRIYLYSDGVIEAGEGQRRAWGIRGLADFVQTHHDRPLAEILDRIVAEARARHGNSVLPDDLSLLALELTGTA
jgi:PAS domain S-box-containing protein